MVKLSSPNILIFLSIIGCLKDRVNGELQQIMKQGDRLRVGFKKDFHDGFCRVTMKARGSLAVLKGDDQKKLMWQTGQAPGHVIGDKYKLQLREVGNMVIKRIVSPDGPRETVTVYDTHTEGGVGEYFLGINEDCVLQIREGTLDIPGDLVWTNIKYIREGKPVTIIKYNYRFQSGDGLGVSEIFSYSEWSDYFMFMNPNGNLEIYEGLDFTDVGDKGPVWESNTKRRRGDYRFKINEYAELSLHDVATGEQYWEKDLQNSGHPPTSIDWLSLVSFIGTVRDNSVGPYEWFHNDDNVFMREGDKLPAGSVYASDKCVLYVQYDGRLDVDDGYFRPKWSSGKAKDDTIGDDYYLMLHETGNLAMYRRSIDNPAQLLWATHTRGEVGDYFLSTSPNCNLKIFKGTPEEKGKLVWSNRVNTLRSGDRLIKAQYFVPSGSCGVFMALMPDTGVFGIYNESCLDRSIYEIPECFEDPKWSFDTGLGEYDDFYVKVGYDGKLKFYGVSENGDVLMKEQFDLGGIDGEFEVALCDESRSILPKSINTAV